MKIKELLQIVENTTFTDLQEYHNFKSVTGYDGHYTEKICKILHVSENKYSLYNLFEDCRTEFTKYQRKEVCFFVKDNKCVPYMLELSNHYREVRKIL